MDPRGGAPGRDRLSALPVDVLLLILLRLDTATAGRTSVLSHHWRRIWALLPELRFPADADLRLVASALAAHEAAISYLDVRALDAAPESVEACLALAADRLSGRLVFRNRVSPGGNADGDGETGGFHLPCLDKATAVSLDLGFLGLAVPTTGVFARLTELSLLHVRLRCSSWGLSDAVSSRRCPCLQKLSIDYARGLANLTIESQSLLELNLQGVDGLQQLIIAARALNKLHLIHSSVADGGPLVAVISTPQLVSLGWVDLYGSTSILLGNWPRLENLHSSFNRFQFIRHLHITLLYLKVSSRLI
nr:unnamed protein product [Digitaria exilis]